MEVNEMERSKITNINWNKLYTQIKETGKNVFEFSEELGFENYYISCCKDRKWMYDKTLNRIASALNMKPEDLLLTADMKLKESMDRYIIEELSEIRCAINKQNELLRILTNQLDVKEEKENSVE